MNLLSSLNRTLVLQKMQEEPFDLVVIGGGITGAGIALDAASRGLKVALVEKSDFASGSSSKSTKLIHGGLRYLKQLEIALVREVGRERATVHRLAPHLVTAEKMLLPLVRGGSFGEWATSLGLWVYDVLAGVEGDDKRKMLDKEETLGKEPLLRSDILQGGGFYAEYRTDDARLTIENIKTAGAYGAVCINYVEAVDFVYDDQKVVGVKCRDLASQKDFKINSSFVISAAGPWVDSLRKVDHSLEGKHLFLSKGVHIVVPHQRFPVKHSVYFDVPDGRMIFAIPRHRITYIGTTDTPYQGDINSIPVHVEDVKYLLDGVNQMFPEIELSIADVESSWAGLRPLIHEEGKSASEMSRKDEIFESESGLISIAGGKLTGFRKMAERVVDVVAKKYEKRFDKKLKDNHTDEIPLTGGPFENQEEVEAYRKKIEQRIQAFGLLPYYSYYLVANYGLQTEIILDHLQSFNDPATTALARSEVHFAIHNELALTPLDFFNRRTGRMYFNLPSIKEVLPFVLEDFKTYFNWDEATFLREKEEVENMVYHASHFSKKEANIDD